MITTYPECSATGSAGQVKGGKSKGEKNRENLVHEHYGSLSPMDTILYIKKYSNILCYINPHF